VYAFLVEVVEAIVGDECGVDDLIEIVGSLSS
jgi:hypothetical protein